MTPGGAGSPPYPRKRSGRPPRSSAPPTAPTRAPILILDPILQPRGGGVRAARPSKDRRRQVHTEGDRDAARPKVSPQQRPTTTQTRHVRSDVMSTSGSMEQSAHRRRSRPSEALTRGGEGVFCGPWNRLRQRGSGREVGNRRASGRQCSGPERNRAESSTASVKVFRRAGWRIEARCAGQKRCVSLSWERIGQLSSTTAGYFLHGRDRASSPAMRDIGPGANLCEAADSVYDIRSTCRAGNLPCHPILGAGTLRGL